MPIAPPLNVGWGYGVVLGFGALFALGMVYIQTFQEFEVLFLTTLDSRHLDPQALQP